MEESAIDLSPIRVHPRGYAVQKCDRPVRQKERSAFPPSASIPVYQRFKSAIGLSPIRVHQRVSAVQKCDRPVRQKERSTFPHPRPSACICGSKVRSTLPPSASIRVYLRFKSAIGLSSKRAIAPSINTNKRHAFKGILHHVTMIFIPKINKQWYC
jgi:hypothetical protein